MEAILNEPEGKQVLHEKSKEEPYDKAWAKIYDLAGVPVSGPRNREERRRVERVLARLKKRGLTIR